MLVISELDGYDFPFLCHDPSNNRPILSGLQWTLRLACLGHMVLLQIGDIWKDARQLNKAGTQTQREYGAPQ